MGDVCIDKSAMEDLVRLTNEINDRVESLLLMSDSEVMEGHRRSKEQIKNRDFGNWDEL
ncbi:MAG: hypothetical protein WC584_02880 [Candidatus Pacearchaeota archaeon]